MKDLNREGAERLVEAIVRTAIRDWKNAMSILADHPEAIGANKHKIECEKFFLSDYFYGLTGVDGRRLLSMLQKEIEQ